MTSTPSGNAPWQVWLTLVTAAFLAYAMPSQAQTAGETLFGRDIPGANTKVDSLRRTGGLEERDLRGETGRDGDSDSSEPDEPLFENFSRYIKDTTGKVVTDALPLKRSGTQTPKLADSYVLGSDDEIEIQVWGSLSARYLLRLDDTARVFIPDVGSVNLTGVTAGKLSDVLAMSFARIYKGFQLRAVVSRARAVSIFVIGQARTVGLQNVSAMNTVLSATLSVARPNNGGSRRFLELRRPGRPSQAIDLYCFFREECAQFPDALRDGDTLRVPARGKLVALSGAVARPGIYELAANESAADLLRYAGGVSLSGDVGKVSYYTFAGGGIGTRSLRSVTFDELCANEQAPAPRRACIDLVDGDHLDVQPRLALVTGMVTVAVAGIDAIKVQLKPGLKLLDVLKPPFEQLLPARALALMNAGAYNVLGDLDNRLRRLDLDGVTIQRLDLMTREYVALSVDYRGAAVAPGSAANLLLQDGDVIVIDDATNWKLRRDQQTVTVRVMGEVGKPGRYRFTGIRSLRDVIEQAGGLTPDAATWGAIILRYGDGRSAVNREVLDRALKGINEFQLRQEAVNSNTGTAAAVTVRAVGERTADGTLQTVSARTQAEVRELMSGRDVVYAAGPDGSLGLGIMLAPDDVILLPPKLDTFACQGAFFRPGAFEVAQAPVPLREAAARCGLIDEMDPNLYHFIARQNRVCRLRWFNVCPDVQGGDALVAVPAVITKRGTSAVLEWLDLALRSLTTLATIQVLSR